MGPFEEGFQRIDIAFCLISKDICYIIFHLGVSQ